MARKPLHRACWQTLCVVSVPLRNHFTCILLCVRNLQPGFCPGKRSTQLISGSGAIGLVSFAGEETYMTQAMHLFCSEHLAASFSLAIRSPGYEHDSGKCVSTCRY